MNPTLTVAERETLLKLARAAQLERSGPRLSPIEPVDRGGPLALSFAQQRLWFLEQLGGMGSTYHVRRRLRLRGELHRAALVKALDRIMARHEALRTTFALVDGEPEQRIASVAASAFRLVEHDLAGDPDAGAELARLAADEAAAPFDLERGPLIRGRLVRLAEDDHVLLVTMHHIVSDAWSMGVLVNELGVLYAAFRAGGDDPLPPLPVQYADYAAWQRRWVEGEVLEAQAAYWAKTLAGAPELLELPTDHPRPVRQDHAGASVAVELDEALTAALKTLGQRHGTTLFMTLLAGWAAVLGRLSGQADVVVGTPSANRGRREVEGLIGFFLNTLALRVELSGSPTIAGLLERVRERALEAQHNQDIPFEQVVERVQPSRSLAHSPVFQVAFTWQNTPRDRLTLPGLELAPLPGVQQETAKFDLSLSLSDEDGRIAGALTYATSLFEPETAERFAGYLRRALEEMAADDGRRVDRLDLLPRAERRRVVEEWNATAADYPSDACVHHLFEAQAARTPDAPAVVHEDRALTYDALNVRANRLAHFLVQRGVGPDVRVGLCVERGVEVAVAVLAVLKAGGAYLPLDPGYPAERLRYMLDDGAPAVLLTQAPLAERFAGTGVAVVRLDADAAAWSALPETNPEAGALGPEHLVYVIYTSGSTGRPKGVMNVHRNLVNRIAWMQSAWRLEAGESLLQNASLSFDVSAYELFWPLMAGARVVLARHEGHRDPGYLVETIREHAIGTASFVPSMLQLFLEHPEVERCTSLLRVPCGGEALPPALVRRFHERLPGARLYNRYGPSEAATAVTGEARPWGEAKGGVPIGRPVSNARVYLLDAQGGPVPVGVVGELYIGGAGVGRGYLGRPALTAERFVPDPFGREPGARLYRTGDVARWRADGTLEFLGRNDDQVKVRGFRVEPGEVAARLAEHPGVREAVVAVREDTPGDRRLVAWYVGAAGAVEAEALRAHLSERLPEYMVPAAYVALPAMPLSPNGKLDRLALPAPGGDAYARRGYEAPAGETEAALAEIWAEVLGVDGVGRWDHFFELGGHSLLAVRVISRVRQVLGVEAALGEVFERQVLADFARGLEAAARADLPPIEAADRGGRLALSFAQQRLWFLEQLGSLGSTYHIRRRMRMRGALDRAALVRALDRIVTRHEALRTTFAVVDGEPEQRIAPAEESAFHLLEHDLARHADAEAELRRLVAEEGDAPFDLEHGPLLRGRLVRLAADDHVLLLTLHHIVSDAWSMGVLVHEFGVLYAAFHVGAEDPLPPLPVQYADYAAWQRHRVDDEVLEVQGAYWQKALAGAPELLELPADHARPTQQDYAGGVVPIELDEALTAGLKALGRRQGTTLFMTLLAGWAAVLGRLSGQTDVVVGTSTANRRRREVEGLIGFFLNTLALRVDLSGSPTIGELLGRVKARALEAQQNQDIPFEQVVERVRPGRSLAHAPVAQVQFVWQNTPRETLRLPGLELSSVAGAPQGTAKFDLLLALSEAGGRIVGGLTYASSLVERATAERFANYLRRLLEEMAADPARRVERLEVLPEAERRRVLEEWNATETAYPADACVHELFAAQAARTPDAVALVSQDQPLAYGELNRRANRLAHFLAERGVGPDVRVGLCTERGPEMVVAVLAVLKAGGAYVPLDSEYPAERLRYLLADSAPAVLLTETALAERFAGLHVPVVRLDADAAAWAHHAETNRARGDLTPDHLAYVIYTSGSTGRPKGVMVPHAGLTNYVCFARSRYTDGGPATFPLCSPLAFDLTVTSLYLPLVSGGAIAVAPREEGDRAILRVFDEDRADGVKLTPSHLALLARRDLAEIHVRRLVVGGEELKTALARSIHEASAGRLEIINEYGPTEATVGCVVRRFDPERDLDASVPIGAPIANARVYVLDAAGEPVPVGVVGELYVGGVQVARGYLGRPERTAERFVADPFGAPGGRLYRTGDRARWRADATLEYLGRDDHQVKVRGYRIELGEIEARLAEHPGVREAVVAAREDAPGDRRLVAWYVGERGVDAVALRAHLGERLPEHMVPAAYVALDAMPLTPNGKVDRQALPAPGGDAFARRGHVVPASEMEEAVAELWAEVLGVERVGRHDHFFLLGGHSLRAVQVVSRVRQVLGIRVGLGEVFERPVLADFARGLEMAGRARLPPIEPVDRHGPLAPSFAQQRLWFLEQLGGMGATYHIPRRLRLRGTLDRDALGRALDRIVARHEALRTTFVAVDGEPEQRIGPAEESAFPLVQHDLGGRPDAEAELHRLMAEEALAPFDLRHGPLIRGRLVRLAADDHVLLVTLHHVVSDAWSMGVLVDELSVLYAAFREGRPDPLPPLLVQYADYAAWQRRWVEGEVLQAQAAYWMKTLAGAPELLELPTDHPRPARQDHAGATLRAELDEALTAGLKSLGQRHGTTLFMTLIAAWAAVLGRLSGQDDVVIGTPTANRGRREIEGLIGFFINTLALRVDLSGSPTVGELLARVKARALEAQQNQDIPFEQVVEGVQPARSLAHAPVFQVMFSWQNTPRGTLELPGLELAPVQAPSQGTAKFDLSLALSEAGGRITGALTYATSLFEPATVERFPGYLRRVLEAMAAGDGERVDRLRFLPDSERAQVVETWNATAAAYPADACIHDLFEAQAARTPAAVAVVHEGDALSYHELNRRANRLAHFLAGRGVGPDVRVGLCVERSPAMVAGLLAVLKAGGAYVPLDPSYPDDRLRHMLADGAPAVLLTQASLVDRFAGLGVPVVALDADAFSWADRAETNPGRGGRTPEHLAYVIYTSGSTGQPKGVMNLHRGLVNRLAWAQAAWGMEAGEAVLQQTSLSFDGLVRELLLPLLVGARVVLARPDGHRDPAYLLETIRAEGITTLNLVPSLLQLLLESPELESLAGLRRVLCGGEALPTALLERFRERLPGVELHNLYGPSEAATALASLRCTVDAGKATVPIGRPIANTRAYVLDADGEPVPAGVVGELHIGGAGVARGYLDRPELTAERFVADPFGEPGARLYRTGDLGRWLADGRIEFAGRNDAQVKVRGFRVEPGEIEARLAEHPGVREAVVVVREDAPGDRRLVAYHVGAGVGAEALRAHLSERLPEYMVPAAYVALEALPLTPNGKLDRRALPAPDGDAYARRGYEAPVGETEVALAASWSEVLGLEEIGRGDNFFELGGHSLLAVRLIERMRRRGLHAEVRALFTTPTLAELAATVRRESFEVAVPPNRIPTPCDAITPEMLPLVELSQEEIDTIVAGMPGGARNLQDVYPLAPLQEGILFHHLMTAEGDPYVVSVLSGFETRERLDAYVAALQAAVDRHDVLRTAVVWEGLREPVQVVWRQARLELEEVELDGGGDAAERLYARFDPRRHRFDVRRAPLVRVYVARDAAQERWLLLLLRHHLVSDHTTQDLLREEVQAHLLGRADQLPPPLPFRNYVAQARLGVSRAEHEAFFRELLGDVDEPTPPFGLLDAWGDGSGVADARLVVEAELGARLREHARRLGVSAASIFHLAWAQVLARTSGRGDVVFGTVLFGRMHAGEGSDRVLGLFVNTLPVRVRVGPQGVEAGVRGTHRQLADLLRHEHASLALAQRCSRVEAPAPLFTAVFNYRHLGGGGKPRTAEAAVAWGGMRAIYAEERTNYPVALSVGDWGDGFGLKAQVPASVGPERVCAMMHRALEGLVDALEVEPERPLGRIDVLPDAERRQVVELWNATETPSPRESCIHERFAAQAEQTPDAVAVVCDGEALTYAELNRRANRLAHSLAERGVGPDVRVGLCVERSLDVVVGLLGVLKAGGAYLPLDPAYPEERLRYMLADGAPAVLLTQSPLAERFAGLGIPLVILDADVSGWAHHPETNPERGGLTPDHLAYVIYTSGSTGRPKGVMVAHRGVCNLAHAQARAFAVEPESRVLQFASLSFDACVFEVFMALGRGAALYVPPRGVVLAGGALVRVLADHAITHATLTPAVLGPLPDGAGLDPVRTLVVAGDVLTGALVKRWAPGRHLLNAYGPTEASVWATIQACRDDEAGNPPIGRPIANARVYVLDGDGEPAPVGVAGELYVGGAGVARGYLGRPALTAERFVADPFGGEPGARLYRTGDLGRWRAEGTLEFLGRADAQVKVRGYRIEPGEIEARLAELPGVREAAVVAREDTPGDRRLVAYVVPDWERMDAAAAGVDGDGEGWEAEHQADWMAAFELAHGDGPARADPAFDLSGWNSSYTGLPVPAQEMREWVDATVARIASLAPRRVLEIGCGTGLLLSRVAPACERFVGTDFSPRALAGVETLRRARPELAQVELLERTADDFAGFEPGSFDTVVINSVAQYLPGIEYLLRVLEGAVRVVAPGGHVFVGDVRDLRLLGAFHTAVETVRSRPGRSVAEWRDRAEQAELQETELVIDPAFFWSLGRELPAVGAVETLQKRGRFRNELTEFRYDVVLHVGRAEDDEDAEEGARVDWEAERLTPAALAARLDTAGGDVLELRGIPNARVGAALRQMEIRRDPQGVETVEDVRRLAVEEGVDPEALWRPGEAAGWTVEVRLADSGDPGRVDARFTRGADASRRKPFLARPRERRELAGYATDPLRGRRTGALVRRLREHLAGELPEYMVPAAYVALERLPLTPNGKVDRKALPAPEGDAYARRGYEAPATETEAALAEIWSEVLGVRAVGRRDNFFELGGHSLLAVRLIERMRQRGLHASVQALLTNPTLAGMAAVVGGESVEVQVPPNLIPDLAALAPPARSERVELVL